MASAAGQRGDRRLEADVLRDFAIEKQELRSFLTTNLMEHSRDADFINRFLRSLKRRNGKLISLSMRIEELYRGRYADLSDHTIEMQFIKSSIENARSIADGIMRGLGMNVVRSEWGVCSDAGTTDSLNLNRYVVNESDDSFASENATSMTNPRAPDHFSPTDDCIAQSHPVFRWPNLPQVEEKEFRIPYFHVTNDGPFLSSAIDRNLPPPTTATHDTAASSYTLGLRPSTPADCGGLSANRQPRSNSGEYHARGVSPASLPAEQVSHAFSYLSLSEQNSAPVGSGFGKYGAKYGGPGYRGVLTLVEANQGGVTMTPILEEYSIQDSCTGPAANVNDGVGESRRAKTPPGHDALTGGFDDPAEYEFLPPPPAEWLTPEFKEEYVSASNIEAVVEVPPPPVDYYARGQEGSKPSSRYLHAPQDQSRPAAWDFPDHDRRLTAFTGGDGVHGYDVPPSLLSLQWTPSPLQKKNPPGCYATERRGRASDFPALGG